MKTMRVKVAPLRDSLVAVIYYEGARHRRLPVGEAVEVPCTSYYLRKIHQGELIRVDGIEEREDTE